MIDCSGKYTIPAANPTICPAATGTSHPQPTETPGQLPARTIITGIQPADLTLWGMELDERVAARFIELCGCCLQEVRKAGGSWVPRRPGVSLAEVGKAIIRSQPAASYPEYQPGASG